MNWHRDQFVSILIHCIIYGYLPCNFSLKGH